MHSQTVATAVLALASGVLASTLNVNNWCNTPAYIYQSNNGGCDSGPNGICSNKPGAAPFYIVPGNGKSSILDLGWIKNGEGTSVKISRVSGFNQGILQFEYTFSNALYWDLSDLDGSGAGLAGSPYSGVNVKVSPTGDGTGQGTCLQIKCPANQLCVDAYQHSDDHDTRTCPLDVGDFWIDLCEPESNFNSRRRGVGVDKDMRRRRQIEA